MDQNPVNPQPQPAPSPAPAAPAAPAATQPAQPAPAQPVPTEPIAPPQMNLTPEKDPKGKRSKTIAVISIISALVIAGIVGVVLVILNVVRRNDPETIAFDAMTNLMKTGQTPTAVSGSINFSVSDDSKDYDSAPTVYGFTGLSLNFNTNTKVSDSTTNVELAMELSDGSQITLKLGETVIRDGKIYISFSGLGQAIDDYFASLELTIDDIAAYEEYSFIVDLYNLIDFAENEWWEISIADLVDEYGEILGDYGQTVKEAYACSRDAINKFADDPSEFITAYDTNRFLSIEKTGEEKSGTGVYIIGLDADTLISFYDAAKETSTAKDYKNCLSKLDMDTTDEDITKSIRSFVDELPTLTTEINLDHRFSRLSFEKNLDGVKIDTDLNLSYPDSLDISAPAEYRPISDLINEILAALDY